MGEAWDHLPHVYLMKGAWIICLMFASWEEHGSFASWEKHGSWDRHGIICLMVTSWEEHGSFGSFASWPKHGKEAGKLPSPSQHTQATHTQNYESFILHQYSQSARL